MPMGERGRGGGRGAGGSSRAPGSAVTSVTGRIFREGWSRVRGSRQGLGDGGRRHGQMVRAARGNRAAVFKAIRSGGCHDRAALVRQLEYLTTKSSHIVDSRGVLDGRETLTADEIGAVADRYVRRWRDGLHPKLGHTTHMLMSFPVGTKGTDVRDIASEVCARFFSAEDSHFDYLIAVHEDRAHPHAHVVLNRRSQEGELFWLGKDHRFNYDDLRVAMVEAAETHGVRLEATRRLDRGLVHYAPRTQEVYAAHEEGRLPVERERTGRDLRTAEAQVRRVAKEYRRLGRVEQEAELGEALFRAGELLARGGKLEPHGEVYAPREQSFEELRAAFEARLERVDALIAEKPDAERPAMEKARHAVLRDMALKGDVAETDLRIDREAALAPPSDGGTYSAANIRAEGLDALQSPELRARVETALRETGIGSALVLARIEAGAEDAALERDWLAQDLRAIAGRGGLDLARDDHRALAEARLDAVHVDLGVALAEAGVLRTAGVEEVDALDFHYDEAAVERRCQAIRESLLRDGLSEAQVVDQAAAIEERACAEIAREQRDWIERMADDAVFPVTPSALYRETEDGTLALASSEVGHEVQQGVGLLLEYVGGSEDVADTIAASLSETFPTMPEHLARGLGRSYATAYALRMAEVAQEAPHGLEKGLGEDEATLHRQGAPRAAQGLSHGAGASPWAREVPYPEIDRIVARMRADGHARPFDDAAQRLAFRREVEEALGADAVVALRAGDADALMPMLDDRTDRLRAAFAYLKSDPDHAIAHGDAIRHVIDELVAREVEEERLVHGHQLGDGLTH